MRYRVAWALQTARFHAAQIVMAVQCLHGESIVFRDLQPENIMLDHKGYVKLVDFGNAKRMDFDDPTARAWTLCGRPEYLAPEMVKSLGHGKEVDWWALGVILHEMLAGYPPFYHADSFAVYKLILQDKITTECLPKHFETFAKDLIKKLMTKDKTKRIGSSKNGAEDIKKHKWYAARTRRPPPEEAIGTRPTPYPPPLPALMIPRAHSAHVPR